MKLDKNFKFKLQSFLGQNENMAGIVCLLSIFSYLILMAISKNMYVLLCGYIFFYVLYTKVYKFLYKKYFKI